MFIDFVVDFYFQLMTHDVERELSADMAPSNMDACTTPTPTQDTQGDLPHSTHNATPLGGLAHNVPKVQCRMKGYEPLTAIKNLKANYYGELMIF